MGVDHGPGRFTRCPLHRRDFLRSLPALPLGLGAMLGHPSQASAGASTAPEPEWRTGPAVIRTAFARRKGDFWMSWPGRSYPVDSEQRRYATLIREAGERLGVTIVPALKPIYDQTDSATFLERLGTDPPDGVLLVLLDRHGVAWPTAGALADTGIPSVIFAPIGAAFTTNTQSQWSKPGVHLVSSLEFGAVEQGLKMIRAAVQMRNSRILLVKGNDRGDSVLPDIGCHVRTIPLEDFAKAYDAVPESQEVRAIANRLRAAAKDCIEPTYEDLIGSARMYLAAREVLTREDGDAITMNCLGLASSKRTPVPCLAWMKLNDEGDVTASCEADMNACPTLLLVRYLFDRPGFMQDPVAKTVHETLIGSHCMCATRLDGFDRPPAPYVLRSHHSDTGVVPQTLWRIGEPVTVTQFMGTKKLLISSGTVVGNVDTPPAGGCRTVVELKLDTDLNMNEYPGFHQVFFYGNHAADLRAYCQMHGIEAVEG
jgi:hypothetical protein